MIRNDTVLKGQWLGQVVLYGLFEAGGINAVVAFRVAVLLARTLADGDESTGAVGRAGAGGAQCLRLWR